MTAEYNLKLSGTVLKIERSSIHDGEGFRTVVFMKGCPLRCLWCSTPESLSNAIETVGENTYGKIMSIDELMIEIRKDSIFYFHSNGGLTLSGGEPLVQADFSSELLRSACHEGINTAMESSLAVPFSKVEKTLPYLNTLYADMKHIDPDQHKRYCGMDNTVILDNIRRIDARAGGLRLIIRIPLVPGINDDPETLAGMGQFAAGLKNLQCLQLLPYHRLGTETYRRLGLAYPLASLPVPNAEHMEVCREIIREHAGAACC